MGAVAWDTGRRARPWPRRLQFRRGGRCACERAGIAVSTLEGCGAVLARMLAAGVHGKIFAVRLGAGVRYLGQRHKHRAGGRGTGTAITQRGTAKNERTVVDAFKLCALLVRGLELVLTQRLDSGFPVEGEDGLSRQGRKRAVSAGHSSAARAREDGPTCDAVGQAHNTSETRRRATRHPPQRARSFSARIAGPPIRANVPNRLRRGGSGCEGTDQAGEYIGSASSPLPPHPRPHPCPRPLSSYFS